MSESSLLAANGLLIGEMQVELTGPALPALPCLKDGFRAEEEVEENKLPVTGLKVGNSLGSPLLDDVPCPIAEGCDLKGDFLDLAKEGISSSRSFELLALADARVPSDRL